MRKNDQTFEIQTVIRKRNQLTLPSEAAELLNVQPGDVVVFQIKDGSATLRPVRRSYCGIGRGAYGDVDEFVARERAAWE